MKNEQVKKTMKGALILSIASLIAKILSAVYRIPLKILLVILVFMSISRSIRSMGSALLLP